MAKQYDSIVDTLLYVAIASLKKIYHVCVGMYMYVCVAIVTSMNMKV